MVENNIYGNPLVYKIPEINESKTRCMASRLFEKIPARVVLYLLSWSGFLVSFMLRTDINLTIVAMVKLPPPVVEENVNDTRHVDEFCYDPKSITKYNDTTSFDEGTLEWSSTVQSAVLSSFYWAYIVSQVAGGLATQKVGTKRVFGWAQFVTALCSLSIPIAAVTHYGAVIALRCIQGFASGLTWPAMFALVGHWIPTSERSRFMSSFQGFSIGIGVTYPLCGFLIAHFGWRSVFYTTGSIGLIWCIFWYLLAFDSPETHPRISNQEKKYIADNTIQTLASSRQQTVPWKRIFLSMPVWAIAITTFGRIWVHYTFIIPGPMFMKTVLGFSIQQNGLLSGAPFICSYIASVLFCYVADKLTTSQILTLTNVRKLFTALSQVVPGLLCLAIVFIKCNLVLIITCWFIAVTMITASYAGAMANVVDLAPNFAGPVLAFAQTIHMSASFLSPLVAYYITQDGHTIGAWNYVWTTTATIAIGTYLVYQIFGTGHVQPWNDPNNINNCLAETDLMIQNGGNNSTIITDLSLNSNELKLIDDTSSATTNELLNE